MRTRKCRLIGAWRQGGSDLWAFDCPDCGKQHLHGAGAGHRVSHCLRAKVGDEGYILELADATATSDGRAI